MMPDDNSPTVFDIDHPPGDSIYSKRLDPKLKTSETPHWERAFELFDLLL